MASASSLGSSTSWADLVEEEELMNRSSSEQSPNRFAPSPRYESPSSSSSTSDIGSISPQSSGSGVYEGGRMLSVEEERARNERALDIKDRCVMLLGTNEMNDGDVLNMLEGLMVEKLINLINSRTGAKKEYYYVMFSDKETFEAAIAKGETLQNPKTLRPVHIRCLEPLSARAGQDPNTIRVVGMYKYVSHTNIEAVRKQATTYFSSFGDVRRVNVHIPKGRGERGALRTSSSSPPQVFVTFYHTASAALALMFTHNSVYNNETLNVVFAQERER